MIHHYLQNKAPCLYNITQSSYNKAPFSQEITTALYYKASSRLHIDDAAEISHY